MDRIAELSLETGEDNNQLINYASLDVATQFQLKREIATTLFPNISPVKLEAYCRSLKYLSPTAVLDFAAKVNESAIPIHHKHAAITWFQWL